MPDQLNGITPEDVLDRLPPETLRGLQTGDVLVMIFVESRENAEFVAYCKDAIQAVHPSVRRVAVFVGAPVPPGTILGVLTGDKQHPRQPTPEEQTMIERITEDVNQVLTETSLLLSLPPTHVN